MILGGVLAGVWVVFAVFVVGAVMFGLDGLWRQAVAAAGYALALLGAAGAALVARAVLDGIEALRELAERRDGVAVQVPPVRPAEPIAPVYSTAPRWPLGAFETYRGFTLAGTMASVIADGQAFPSPEEARRHIDAKLGAGAT